MRAKTSSWENGLPAAAATRVGFGRLIRLGHVGGNSEVNEDYIADGGVGPSRRHLHHFPFTRNSHIGSNRHNRLDLGGDRQDEHDNDRIVVRELLPENPIDRRRLLKQCLYRVPLRGRDRLFYIVYRAPRSSRRPGRMLFRPDARRLRKLLITLQASNARSRQRIGGFASSLFAPPAKIGSPKNADAEYSVANKIIADVKGSVA